jgi:VanZ family protein
LSESTPWYSPQRVATLGAWLSWMGLIFYFSTKSWGGHETESVLNWLLTRYLPPIRTQLSHTDLNTLNYVVRKLAHFTEYAILTILGYWAWFRALNQPSLLALRYTLGVSVLFAISDEFHQLFEPGRTSAFADVMIDGLGASAAALLMLKFFVRPQLSRPSP